MIICHHDDTVRALRTSVLVVFISRIFSIVPVPRVPGPLTPCTAVPHNTDSFGTTLALGEAQEPVISRVCGLIPPHTSQNSMILSRTGALDFSLECRSTATFVCRYHGALPPPASTMASLSPIAAAGEASKALPFRLSWCAYNGDYLHGYSPF